MNSIDEYLALESLGCETLFDDLLEPADEGVGDKMKTIGSKIMEVIDKLIHKIMDIYRKLKGINAIQMSKTVNDAVEKIVTVGSEKIYALIKESKSEEALLSNKSLIDEGIKYHQDAINEFNKIKMDKDKVVDKDDNNNGTYKATVGSIDMIKKLINHEYQILKKVRVDVHSNKEPYKNEAYTKLMSLVSQNVVVLNKVLYEYGVSVKSNTI